MKNLKKVGLVSVFVAAASITAYNYSGETIEDPVVKNPTFLFLSDIHLDSFTNTTDYEDDTGMILWNAFLTKADAVIKKNDPDFIIYTGDLPSHIACCFAIPESMRIAHNKNMETILSSLRDLATKNKKTFLYLPGNNDGIAGDYASYADEKDSIPTDLVPEKNNPYPALNINKTGNKAPVMVSNPAPKLGYYSAKPIEGLRVISLNTVIHSANYFNADGGSQYADATQQMTWLANQLKEAKSIGEKAYIAMHIPPGINAYGYKNNGLNATNWKKSPAPNDWNNQFLSIVAQYSETITGILYGHTHMDELRRLYDASGKNITEIAISCPGVTPIHDNNPGFKLVSYDATSKELMDFTTYYTIPSSSVWGDASYSFNTNFGYDNNKTMYENLVADSLDSISKKMDVVFWVDRVIPKDLEAKIKYDITPGIEVKMEQ